MARELIIDPDLCVGSGECAALAPDVFVLDDITARVIDGAPCRDLPAIEGAIAACPTGAITRMER
jgi:ferredoxin